MKKFNLTIPNPCHENWNQMTPDEKGRFCGSCQKTVIDFTHMSDRELADFFKKPATAGTVCGRFQKEQLNREISVPKKPIPWLRHVVHIAWPAFILMLKSCNIKDRLTGNSASSLALSDTRSQLQEYDVVTMGLPLMLDDTIPAPPVAGQVEITAATAIDEDSHVKGEVAAIDYVEPGTLMGDIVMVPIKPEPVDSVVVAQAVNEIDTGYVEMDTVTVVGSGTHRRRVISCNLNTRVNHTGLQMEEVRTNQTLGITVFPNPVRAGSILNLKLAAGDSAPVSIQLLTISGQRILHKQLPKGEQGNLVLLPLPAGLSAGVYFLQAVDVAGATIQSRILVNH